MFPAFWPSSEFHLFESIIFSLRHFDTCIHFVVRNTLHLGPSTFVGVAHILDMFPPFFSPSLSSKLFDFLIRLSIAMKLLFNFHPFKCKCRKIASKRFEYYSKFMFTVLNYKISMTWTLLNSP